MNLDIERVTRVGPEPFYSPFGYVVAEDATIYSLTQQWTHGVILALLYPDIAEEQRIGIPGDDFDVFAYQRFELDNHERFPVIRVAFGMVSDFAISKGKGPATEKQCQAMAKILRMQDKGLNDKVQTDLREVTVRSALKWLRTGADDD